MNKTVIEITTTKGNFRIVIDDDSGKANYIPTGKAKVGPVRKAKKK
jgi:hypothetical protein